MMPAKRSVFICNKLECGWRKDERVPDLKQMSAACNFPINELAPGKKRSTIFPMLSVIQLSKIALAIGLLAGCLAAQKTQPEFLETDLLAAKRTQPDFENDQIIVNAPHPHVAVPGSTHKMHDHKLNRVMVYLHPGGETIHYLDGRTVDLKWKEGEVMWSPASGMHYSQIPAANPAFPGPMIIDIGIKKPGIPGKILPPFDPRLYKLEFENSQVRVLRLKIGARQSTPMEDHTVNRLVVCLSDQNVRETLADGMFSVKQHQSAQFIWEGPSKSKIENLNDKSFEAIVVEFKS